MAYDSEEFISIGNRRLLALADVLETIPDNQYNQSIWRLERSSCGTVCCALGWGAEKIPEVIDIRFATLEEAAAAGLRGWSVMVRVGEPHPIHINNLRLATDAFELRDLIEADKLFGGGPAFGPAFYGTKFPTPKIVAAKIREFALARVNAGK